MNATDLNNNLVLIVEDDPDLRYLLSEKVRAAGFEPVPVADGVEALQAMAAYPGCRRMITDFSMPALGGESWIRILERFCQDWSIVVISGSDADPGPFVIAPKPVDIQNLITHLQREAA